MQQQAQSTPALGVPPRGNAIRPLGWLRRQLEIQAAGQAGNLDRMWPDVSQSAWIGGDREGWERVPYWLDGFIDLAWMLDDPGLQQRAQRYIDAILARQQPDGWICPCEEAERAEYDIWPLFLIGKVLTVWEHRSGDPRIAPALYKAFRQCLDHIQKHPLNQWARFRWFEALIPLAFLRRHYDEAWIPQLAALLRQQGYDWMEAFRNWTHTEKEKIWTFSGHVVNLAMSLHNDLVTREFFPDSQPEDASTIAKMMLDTLRKHHSMAHGHFTGDECLAGDNPAQGSELCSVVEAMYSYELLLNSTGDAAWGDQLEKTAFNALPATISDDMWRHQYVQSINQVSCRIEPKPIWTTDGSYANIFGLEPNFGCCTANFGQGWPKFAANAYLLGDDVITCALPVPAEVDATINGVSVRCQTGGGYPFHNTIPLTVACASPVEFTLRVRIPGTVDSATLDGQPVQPGSFVEIRRQWPAGESTITMELTTTPHFEARPREMAALWCGPLMFSLQIPSKAIPREYTQQGVTRRYPYHDEELLPTGPWNYAFVDDASLICQRREIPAVPFTSNPEQAAVTITATMAQIPWESEEQVLAPTPTPIDTTPISRPYRLQLVPYGGAKLRMTEMPLIAPQP